MNIQIHPEASEQNWTNPGQAMALLSGALPGLPVELHLLENLQLEDAKLEIRRVC